MKNLRGVFEKIPGSNVWWIRFADASGRIRREIAGPKSAAISLYQKRKTEIRQGTRLPESPRTRAVTFSDLAKSALAYSRGHKRSYKDDECRMRKIRDKFDYSVAEEVNLEDIECWLESHGNWTVATKNRYLALIKLAYRLGEKNRKIKVNLARLIRMRRENNERVRYLNQHEPLPTNQNYLKGCRDEESPLLAVIKEKASFHLPEFLIALHTAMRRSEQYATEWQNVNFERKVLNLTRSKQGRLRHIPLNSIALAAFESLLPNMATRSLVFLNQHGHDSLQGNRHWFEDAVAVAGVSDFTWHDFRHVCESSRHGGRRYSSGARTDGTQNDQHDGSVRPARTSSATRSGGAARRIRLKAAHRGGREESTSSGHRQWGEEGGLLRALTCYYLRGKVRDASFTWGRGTWNQARNLAGLVAGGGNRDPN